MRFAVLFCVFVCSALCAALRAEFYMPGIFSDNMVLQAEKPVKVWGLADAGDEIKIEFGDRSASSKAAPDGRWKAFLEPMGYASEGRDFFVYRNGERVCSFKNVVVGEVWILGGQSNMDWAISKTDDYQGFLKRRGAYSLLRYYNGSSKASVKPQFKTTGGFAWVCLDKANIERYPGTGLYFGEALMLARKVPVGLVRACQSGTAMFVWIPEEAQRRVPFLQKSLADYDRNVKNFNMEREQERWNKMRDAWLAKAEKIKASGGTPPDTPNFMRAGPAKNPLSRFGYPGWLFHGRVYPFAGYTARGVAWYQGEGDSHGERLKNFEDTFKLLVEEWRKAWGYDIPFLYVQIASYGENTDTWPECRLRQARAQGLLKDMYMVSIPDMGKFDDIHFPDKRALAERMRDVALSKIYSEGIKADFPVCKSVDYKGETAVLNIEAFGMELRCPKGSMDGFEAFSDGRWQLAEARLLEGGKILLSLKGGGRIEKVRYLWYGWALPHVSVFGDNGFPLLPFLDPEEI